ncbi:uncharacterized protein LOC106878952 [Octopus bimaculoides]|uniref:Uncharacterized protein n=1 Tax=Octopus bimaculoides TaxID=37653 RepID=A0A0L8G674_OCTBM|nr:uncharacterized protein LOC106878952 [Octopus bimaculoides]XP_014783814.1 uncharacterized protein LOC106878952 [Octopus bimaculoides]|eukprot:XP_014783813.1 PREDICTED: uncharacterized protein LOC106878952 [Octopus bimaculoides]
MSLGCVSVGEWTWSSFRQPSRLLMTMMTIMLMIVMMSPYTSAFIEITNLSPANGFGIGEPTKMNITCEYNTNSFNSFSLLRDGVAVVEMEDSSIAKGFVTKKKEKDFGCNVPAPSSKSGAVHCWKANLDCRDVAVYKCSLSSLDISNEKPLKAKSSIKSVIRVDPQLEKNNTSMFKCTANVALPYTSFVKFLWKIKPENRPNMIEQEISAAVPDSTNCFVEAATIYRHQYKLSDRADVSCTVFKQTITEVFDALTTPITTTTTKKPTTTTTRRPVSGSGVQFSKWVLIINLILLLLDVAVSR